MINFFKKKSLTRKLKKNNNVKYLLMETPYISGVENISIKEGCRFGPGMRINANGGLEVGSNVIFAPNVVIWTQSHHYYNAKQLPYDSVIKNKKVTINDGVWVGEGAKIAPGVIIGKGVIVAIGAVVLDDVADFCIVAGNPAVVIRNRSDVNNFTSLDPLKDSYIINKLKVNV